MTKKDKQIALFMGKQIRRVWNKTSSPYNNSTYGVVKMVVLSGLEMSQSVCGRILIET